MKHKIEKKASIQEVTQDERDKFIIEWFGECWHEPSIYALTVPTIPTQLTLTCSKCGYKKHCISPDSVWHRNLSTPEGFFWLWDKVVKDLKLLDYFTDWIYEKAYKEYNGRTMPSSYFWCSYIFPLYGGDKSIIAPEKFANSIYEFLMIYEFLYAMREK
jgi:hypothetical protein